MDAAEILATMVPHRARWEHLVFYLPPSSLPVINGPMPLLRHLNLSLSGSVADAPESDAASCIILPWAQLTSLTLFNVYPRDCVPILQKTTNLVHCKLEVSFDSDNDEPGLDITLPYLESLSIDQYPVTDFLEKFIVPALRSLKIPEDFIEPDPIQSLTGFISKSGCKLEEVHITGERSLPQDSYRKAFPSIRRFSFDNEDDSSDCDASDVEDNSDSDASDAEDSSDSD
ncbi:hypothetical protein B0H13DRAFT_2352541 [Mycena leptocephala]|nr:hypothetical protein B0H13DRAFT_2352541 [Mycena leptocephala]